MGLSIEGERDYRTQRGTHHSSTMFSNAFVAQKQASTGQDKLAQVFFPSLQAEGLEALLDIYAASFEFEKDQPRTQSRAVGRQTGEDRRNGIACDGSASSARSSSGS